MTARLRDLYENQGAAAVLNIFGLDRVLTDQDDPELWAAVLVRHWPDPAEPDVDPTSLRFGLGCQVPDEGADGTASTRSGMEQLEIWCFERVDTQHLRVVSCGDRPILSFGMMLMGGGSPGLDVHPASLVSDYLDISRPSLGQARALVHAGLSVPPNAGAGETRYWEKAVDGAWVETEEIFFRWLT